MRFSNWERNLIALWIAQTISMVAFSFVFPFFPLYVQDLGVKDVAAAAQWAGAIVAATAVSMAITQPIWGTLADRYGRRPMVIRSMFGGAITVGLMGTVASVQQLLILRFIQGGVTGTIAAANALAASSVPKSRLGFALGLMQVALFVGTSVGPLIGGFLADTLGFRIPFYAASALMVLGGLTVVVFVKEDFTPPALDVPRPGVLTGAKALLGLSTLPMLITVVFLIQLGATIVSPVLTLFISDLNGAENAATVAGLVLAGTGVMSAGAALIFGRLGDRIGHTAILAVCLAGAALTYFPQALVQQVWQLMLLRMALGVFLGGLMPSANALLANLVPRERRGAAFGLSATASSLSSAIGPLSGAAIATSLGMRAIFVFSGVLYTLNFAWVMLGLRRRVAPAPSRRVDVAPGADTLELRPQQGPDDVPVPR
jgi:DHA1 family multidrug resistance protein-like MFS transporter